MRKTEKTWTKKITPINEIPYLNYLKPFEFKPKTNIGDINSSQKQPLEVFCNKSCT